VLAALPAVLALPGVRPEDPLIAAPRRTHRS